MAIVNFSEITPELEKLAELSKKSSYIDPELYTTYDVKRGLRDLNGKGVLVGITDISEVNSKKFVDGKEVPVNDTTTYNNGTGVIPSYLCSPIVVTKDNLKEVLFDSGYYKESEIK